MIGFEDLCQALERFNRRRRNQAEMTELERGGVRAGDRTAENAAPPGGSGEIAIDDFDADVIPMDGEPTQLSSMGGKDRRD